VAVGDNELYAPQSAPGKAAQEVGPERLGFRGTNIEAKDLAPAIAVDADGDDGSRSSAGNLCRRRRCPLVQVARIRQRKPSLAKAWLGKTALTI
jgi:hypothetical protein